MKCKRCGAEIATDSNYCTECGFFLGEEKEKSEPESEKAKEPELERVDAEIVGNANDNAEKATGAAASESASRPEGSVDYSGTPKAAPVFQQNFTSDGNGSGPIALSIISMVCGILSIVCCCCSWFGTVCAIAAIVLGILAIKKDADGRGMAIAGIVCGGIGALFGLAAIIIGLASSKVAGLSSILNGGLDSIEDILDGLGGF